MREDDRRMKRRGLGAEPEMALDTVFRRARQAFARSGNRHAVCRQRVGRPGRVRSEGPDLRGAHDRVVEDRFVSRVRGDGRRVEHVTASGRPFDAEHGNRESIEAAAIVRNDLDAALVLAHVELRRRALRMIAVDQVPGVGEVERPMRGARHTLAPVAAMPRSRRGTCRATRAHRETFPVP